MERQKGRCGKADSEGSHPQGETRDLRMEWESSRRDEAYVCAYRPVCDEGLCESSR